MNPTVLGGPAEVALGFAATGITIPASMLSEVSVEFTNGTRERKTMGGKFTRDSGVLETAMAKFTLYLPSMDYLKNIFPGRYNAPTGPQTAGNVIINANTCATTDAGPVNIHWTCEKTDKNDIFMYYAQAVLNFNPTLNADEDVTVEVTLYAQPDTNGNVARFGTGNLTAIAHYDPATKATVVGALT